MKIVLDLDRNEFYPLYTCEKDYNTRNCHLNHFRLAEMMRRLKEQHNDAMIHDILLLVNKK